MDRIDFEILDLLQNNARISNKSLAAKIGLAPSTCFERVKQLNQSGIIQGVHADVLPAKLGIGLEAMYFIGLNKHSREIVEKFQKNFEQIKEVRSIYLVSGKHDFIVHVAVKDTGHLRDLAMNAFTNHPEVIHFETVIIFDHSRKFTLPNYNLEKSVES